MRTVKKKNKKEVTPVNVPTPYTLGLGYNNQDPSQSLENILGKHQAKYMENIFTEMNKFTKTAIMTVVPELFGQLFNIIKQEKQRLIALSLDDEANNPVNEPAPLAPNELKIVKEGEDGGSKDDPEAKAPEGDSEPNPETTQEEAVENDPEVTE